jgi:ABC-type nitrate/sulfonate/bicarbonate transport system permease component
VTHRLSLLTVRVLVVVAALAVWQLWTKSTGSLYFLPPFTILGDLHRQWFAGPPGHLWLTSDATANVLPSLARLLVGWAAASLAGIALGLAIGRLKLFADLVEPIVHFGRAVPAPTLVPVFLVIFGIGTPMEVATIAFGVIWPVLLNTIDGARAVHPGYLETAAAFRLGPAARLIRVILPSAAPKILAGLRLALSLALVMMIISEFVGSTDGIGREVLVAQSNFDVSVMWDAIVLLGLLGVVLNALFSLLEHRALAWQSSPGGAQRPLGTPQTPMARTPRSRSLQA